MVFGGLFLLSHDLFYSTLLYSIHFSPSITICLKSRTFSLCLDRELYVEIWSRRLVFLFVCLFWFVCFAYVESNIKQTNITKLMQIIFNT